MDEFGIIGKIFFMFFFFMLSIIIAFFVRKRVIRKILLGELDESENNLAPWDFFHNISEKAIKPFYYAALLFLIVDALFILIGVYIEYVKEMDFMEKYSDFPISPMLLILSPFMIPITLWCIVFSLFLIIFFIKKRENKKISEMKIFYINNGVDLDEFKKSIVELNDIDLQSQKKKIIYTGSIRKANNVLTLVKAFEKVGKDALLLLYGSGDEVSEIETYILNNGIKNIKYKGRVEKKAIPSILSKGDFNVLTYLPIKDSLVNKYGSSQNKLFEYLASGKPIISNQKYGEYDIIDFYKCGLVKQCDTVEEYEELINRALTLSKEEYEEFHKNTQKMIQKFDWKSLSEELEEIFQYINNV